MRLEGTAVAWRPAIAGLLQEYAAAGRLGFTEVVAENHAPDRLAPELAALTGSAGPGVPAVVHGVTLGLAGAERPDRGRLDHLGRLATALSSPLVSEHVAFVRAATSPDPMHGEVLEAGHLLPPPRTRESLAVVCDNVRRAQGALPVPLAVENIAALFAWPEDTYSEPDFLTELVERTEVGLVLDVANLYSSAVAQGLDAAAELRRFPLEAVAYVHVAGGAYDGGLYLDTHAHPMIAPVLDLVSDLRAMLGDRLPGVLLERDGDVSETTVRPEYDALCAAIQSVQAVEA